MAKDRENKKNNTKTAEKGENVMKSKDKKDKKNNKTGEGNKKAEHKAVEKSPEQSRKGTRSKQLKENKQEKENKSETTAPGGISNKKLSKLIGDTRKKPKKQKAKKLKKKITFFGKVRTKVFDSNEKQADKLNKFAKEVLEVEKKVKKMNQEEMRKAVQKLQKRFQKELTPDTKILMEKGKSWLETRQGGEILDYIIEELPIAFALMREAAHRVAAHKHFEVQVMAGIALSQGRVIEFKTGEGKTLAATLSLFIYSLFGRGAYLVTVNDYLARRDAEWVGGIMDYLGISVGVVNHDKCFKFVGADLLTKYKTEEDAKTVKQTDWSLMGQMKGTSLVEVTKKDAYLCDITYGTHSEFGFDYLRDNMQKTFEQMNQRDPFFCIVDEVDSILIDEARTPLIISDSAEESNYLYSRFAKLVKDLDKDDYTLDEKERAVSLTDSGIKKMEHWLKVDNLWTNYEYAKHLDRALLATYYYQKDDHYIVHNGEIVLVDEFTGRLQPGRRISDGIHQAIEAKENVEIKRESRTMATVTYQNYFRLYPVLSGMTGTALTESEEFAKIYNLDVVEIPTNRKLIRKDYDDVIYKNEDAKFNAIVKDIKKKNKKGRPVLVGTVSVEKSEKLATMLKRAGVKHEVLNAKNHAREADIIAHAGEKGSVTISTNMAGRGTDIKLGKGVADIGGLYVIGTERHESRRIDNQLRGRSGRQGDPGSSRFYLALDDEIMRIHGGDMIKTILSAANVPEDMPFESKFITRSVKGAQKRVEAENFDIRKHLVDYDDVLNKQRMVIYNRRRRIMDLFEEAKEYYFENKAKIDAEIREDGISFEEVRLRDYVIRKLKQQVELIIDTESPEEKLSNEHIENVLNNLLQIMPRDLLEEVIVQKFEVQLDKFLKYLSQNPSKERIKEQMDLLIDEVYDSKERKEGFVTMREIEKYVMLDNIDVHWIDHLENMDDIRSSAGLQGYGQKDPLHTYQNEGYVIFSQMMAEIDADISRRILLYTARAEREARKTEGQAAAKSAARTAQDALEAAFRDAQQKKGAKKQKKTEKEHNKEKVKAK
ncbi:MAG: preprotein translocase subunit SecA [Candidatus Dojkabacteria bacterium]